MKNVTYINAGAGSGKTFTLTRLLAEKLSAEEVDFSQVILTTFTELAATEFREKARTRILKDDKFEQAAQMDGGAIGTVHAVALHFIKKFWYLLDFGADIRTISENDEKMYINQSLHRILNDRDAEGNLMVQKHLDAFKSFREYYNIKDGKRPNYLFWQSYLSDVVEKMAYYNVENVKTSIDKSVETLRKVFNKTLTADEEKSMWGYLDTYHKYIQASDTKTATDQAKVIGPILKKGGVVRNMLPLLSEIKAPVGGTKSIENKCPGYTSFMEKLQRVTVLEADLKVLIPFVESIFTLAKLWRDDYVQYKKRNRLVSYNDMELLFLHLLTNEKEVQDHIRCHYRLVMVDEFQDSNPIQLRIFDRLSELVAEGGGHSYWVGDPKQSIYGFRGSDTDLVNSVAENFHFYDDGLIHPEEGENHLGTGRLVESWRSRPQLVGLVNNIFYQPFVNDGMNKLLIKLIPHFKADSLPDVPAIVHWDCNESNKPSAARTLAAQVENLLKSHQKVHRGNLDEDATEISPRDVAILCRRNEEVKQLVTALRNRNIPVSEPEEAIMQRVEVQLVVTLLQFLQNPSGKHTRADLMRLLWGETTEDILKDRIDYVSKLKRDSEGNLIDDHWKDDVVDKLLEQSGRYKRLSIPEMVRGLIYECDIPALTTRWGDSAIRKQNLSTLQKMADGYDQRCLQLGQGSSISGFIHYLSSIEPEKQKDNLSDTVKVFTYHGSKGLEWPVVILKDLGTDALEQNDFIKKSSMRVCEFELEDHSLSGNPFDKQYYLNLFPYVLFGNQKSVPQMMQDNIVLLDIYKLLHEKAAREERRLLYVGMTRAKDQLVAFGYKQSYRWLENAGVENPSTENVWGLDAYMPENVQVVAPETDTDRIATVEPTCLMIEKPEERTAFNSRYLFPSKIDSFAGYTRHVEWGEKGVEINTKGWGKEYDTIGSCIHDIFAVYQPGADALNYDAALRVIAGYGLSQQLSGHIDALLRSADWLYEQLQQRFPQGEGDSVDREYPFQMTLESGQTLRGEMDLLWHYSDESGKHCVLVDYKTFPGVDLHKHTSKHYAQLSAYAAGLHQAGLDITCAFVYYPVHGVLHKLEE